MKPARAGALLQTAACGLGLWLAAPPIHAEEKTPAAAPQALVTVQPLRDAGGLPPQGIEGQAVNDRLTLALEQYLVDNAAEHFAVTGKLPASHKPPAALKPAILFTVEGELSHVDLGTIDGGPYLCALRLFREGTPRRLLGQWAASARSLRYLTANLKEFPRLDHAGLIGELGKRLVAPIVDFAGADQITQFANLLATTQSPKLSVAILPESATAPSANPASTTFKPGDRFKIQISSKEAGAAYIVAVSPEGQPHAILIPEAKQEVKLTADQAVLLPKEKLPVVDKPLAEHPQIVVLVRRGASGSRDIEPRKITDNAPDSGSPVQIMEAGVLRATAADPDVARLLAQFAADPPGSWLTAQTTLKVDQAADIPPK